jgi:hypothetical protein
MTGSPKRDSAANPAEVAPEATQPTRTRAESSRDTQLPTVPINQGKELLRRDVAASFSDGRHPIRDDRQAALAELDVVCSERPLYLFFDLP